jgi:hypothetical protein
MICTVKPSFPQIIQQSRKARSMAFASKWSCQPPLPRGQGLNDLIRGRYDFRDDSIQAKWR